MPRNPIAVIIKEAGQYISPLARLDCSRIYTVEDNLRVMNIGSVHPKSLKDLKTYGQMGVGRLADPAGLDVALEIFGDSRKATYYTGVLEMDVNQHKETLAQALREISDRDYVIGAQEFLLKCAEEGSQELYVTFGTRRAEPRQPG